MRKRKIYLINPQFQLRFSSYIAFIIIGVSIVYPIIILQMMDYFIQQQGGMTPEIFNKRQSLLLVIVGWQIGYIITMFIICIFFSHKVAGPLYKLNLYLRKIANNERVDRVKFRKGDYFPELADSFNDAVKTLHNIRSHDFEELKKIKEYLTNLSMVLPDDKKIVVNEINVKIDEILSRSA